MLLKPNQLDHCQKQEFTFCQFSKQNFQYHTDTENILGDYLFLDITLTNACRRGSIANRLMSEYFKIKFEKDCSAVIFDKKHKTTSTHGYVGVLFKAIVYK